jgi:hypothetical protein
VTQVRYIILDTCLFAPDGVNGTYEETMKSQVATFLQVGVLIAIVAVLATPALAYWQFIQRPPGVEVKPSPRYGSKQECEAALKKVEAALKKAYPDRYPLVGSCEEF